MDRKRLRTILHKRYAYYDYDKMRRAWEVDARLNPGTREFIRSQFKPEHRVLDIGCGNGMMLLESSGLFREGVGTDEYAPHLKLANENRKRMGITNVRFVRAKGLPFARETFDFVFSERGPLAGCSPVIQNALRVLKPGGMIFAETPGALSWQEFESVFFPADKAKAYQHMDSLDEQKVVFERNGVDIRVLLSKVRKVRFADAYAWLEYHCGIWVYMGRVLPRDPADIARAWEKLKDRDGTVASTEEIVWIGGVKQESPPEYWEYKHFR